jgi:hypothetical protein
MLYYNNSELNPIYSNALPSYPRKVLWWLLVSDRWLSRRFLQGTHNQLGHGIADVCSCTHQDYNPTHMAVGNLPTSRTSTIPFEPLS